MRTRFGADYRRTYGLTIPDMAIEAVTWRLAVDAPGIEVDPQPTLPATAGHPLGTRPVRFRRTDAAQQTPVYRRMDLAAGQHFAGPAIVEVRETTAVIRPGWNVTVADDGSLIAERATETGGSQ